MAIHQFHADNPAELLRVNRLLGLVAFLATLAACYAAIRWAIAEDDKWAAEARAAAAPVIIHIDPKTWRDRRQTAPEGDVE